MLPYCYHHYQTLLSANIPKDLVGRILFLLDCFLYTFMTLCCSSSMVRFLAVLCSTQLVRRMHSCHTASCVNKLPTTCFGLPAKHLLHMLLHATGTLLLLLCMSLPIVICIRAAADAIFCYGHNAASVCGHQMHLASELLLQVQCWILFCQLGCRPAESADSPIHWSAYRLCHNPPQDRTNHCNHYCIDHDPGEHCSSHSPNPLLQPQAVHCRYNAGSFFANWAAVLLSLLTAQSIGLLVGSVITHPKTGQTIATITALTMVLVRTIHHSNPTPLTSTPHPSL